MNKLDNVGLVIGLPFKPRAVTPEWALTLASLQKPIGCSFAIATTWAKPIDEARNSIIEKAIELEASHVFFLDDDVVCPPSTLVHLYPVLAKDKQVAAVAGIYPTKSDPPQPLVFKELGRGATYDWKYGDVFEVEGLATGCMLVSVAACKQMEPPWFRTVQERPTEDTGLVLERKFVTYTISDDLFFCNKALEKGFKLMAHGGILCSHWDAINRIEYKLTEYLPKELKKVV